MTGETCWFCKRAAPDPAAAYHVPLYGNVLVRKVMDGGALKKQTTWDTTVIDVPCCSSCAAVHMRHRKAGSTVGIGCLGIGLGVFVLALGAIAAMSQGSALFATIAAAIFLVLLLGSVALIRSSRQKALRDQAERVAMGIEGELFREQYPAVLALLAKGWRVGDKATGYKSDASA